MLSIQILPPQGACYHLFLVKIQGILLQTLL